MNYLSLILVLSFSVVYFDISISVNDSFYTVYFVNLFYHFFLLSNENNLYLDEL